MMGGRIHPTYCKHDKLVDCGDFTFLPVTGCDICFPSGGDKKDERIAELEAEVERLERQKHDDDAYIVGMDFRIADLEHEIERLRLGLTYVVGNGINTDALEGGE